MSLKNTRHLTNQSFIQIRITITEFNGDLKYIPKVTAKPDKISYQYFWKCQKGMLMEINMSIR